MQMQAILWDVLEQWQLCIEVDESTEAAHVAIKLMLRIELNTPPYSS